MELKDDEFIAILKKYNFEDIPEDDGVEIEVINIISCNYKEIQDILKNKGDINMTIFGVVFINLLMLKLFGLVSISWWLVFSPGIVYFCLEVLFYITLGKSYTEKIATERLKQMLRAVAKEEK